MKTLPNSLLIEGHTDATPYSSDASYSNWDLSADRANSARRLLQQDGVRADQVTQVRGYADQMLRVKSNPTDPSNRRVSILVKNDNETVPTLSASKRGGWNNAVAGSREVANPHRDRNKAAGSAAGCAIRAQAGGSASGSNSGQAFGRKAVGQTQPDGQTQELAAGDKEVAGSQISLLPQSLFPDL